MVNELVDDENAVRINRKIEFVTAPNGNGGNTMSGITYLLGLDEGFGRENILELCESIQNDDAFWEMRFILKTVCMWQQKLYGQMLW